MVSINSTSNYGLTVSSISSCFTIRIPNDLAAPITVLHTPSRGTLSNAGSCDFILAISYICLRVTPPATS